MPASVEENGFTHDGARFLRNGVPRAPPNELKLLFRKKSASWRHTKATPRWIKAQLKFYGIPYNKNALHEDLKKTLEVAVKSERCNDPAPSILAIEKELTIKVVEQYFRGIEPQGLKSPLKLVHLCKNRHVMVPAILKEFLRVYFLLDDGNMDPSRTPIPVELSIIRDGRILEDAVKLFEDLKCVPIFGTYIVGWKERKLEFERAIRRKFEELTPIQQLEFDVERFMGTYFLDGYMGIPAPSKTPETMVLDTTLHTPVGAIFQALQRAVDRVPGLNTCHGKFEWAENDVIVISWGTPKMFDYIQKRTKEHEEVKWAEKKAADEKEWERRLSFHKRFERMNPCLKVGDIRGSYIVKCSATSNGLSGLEFSPDMMLEIRGPFCSDPYETASWFVSSFRFGALAGMMLLAFSEHDLGKLSDVIETANFDNIRNLTQLLAQESGQRELTRMEQVDTKSAVESRNRLYLCWKGGFPENTFTMESTSTHTGYLDFEPSKTAGEGQLHCQGHENLPESIKFSIYKILHVPILHAEAVAEIPFCNGAWKAAWGPP